MASKAAAKVYNDKRHKRIKRILRARNPYCARCESLGIPEVWGDHLDHIVPLKDGGSPFDLRNAQLLCEKHHRIKTARENSGKKRAIPLTDERGYPLPPSPSGPSRGSTRPSAA